MREVQHALQWTRFLQGMHACQINDLDFFRIRQIEALMFHLQGVTACQFAICTLYAANWSTFVFAYAASALQALYYCFFILLAFVALFRS